LAQATAVRLNFPVRSAMVLEDTMYTPVRTSEPLDTDLEDLGGESFANGARAVATRGVLMEYSRVLATVMLLVGAIVIYSVDDSPSEAMGVHGVHNDAGIERLYEDAEYADTTASPDSTTQPQTSSGPDTTTSPANPCVTTGNPFISTLAPCATAVAPCATTKAPCTTTKVTVFGRLKGIFGV